MDITMQKTKKRLMKHNFAVSKLAALTTLSLGTSGAFAGDLTLEPKVSSQAIFQQLESDTRGDRDLTTLQIEPSLRALYHSRKATVSVTGTGTYLDRESQAGNNKDSYLEYRYDAEFRPIDRLLTLQARGSSTYRNANTNNFLLSDFLVNSNDLTRTESNSFSATTDLRRGAWVAGSATAAYSKVRTEQNNFDQNNSRLNNDTISLYGTLHNGDTARTYAWKVVGDYSDTDRTSSTQRDFESYNVDGFVDKQVYNNWAFRVSAQSESHTFGSFTDGAAQEREFDSVGAGIAYRQSASRYLAVTANKANSSNEENDGDVYPSIEVDWAFTTRTSLFARYGKRFYGDAATVRFEHAAKRIRTSFTYSEDVSNFSQLLSSESNAAVFVCPGSFLSALCFQPSGQGYDLQAGEQLVQLGEDNNALEDDVILRKNGKLQISYQASKLRVGVFAQYSDDDYLAQNRLRTTQTFGVNADYRVGAFTNFNTALSFANIERSLEDGISGDGDNTRFSMALSRQFSRYFNVNIGYSYIDSSGDIQTGVFGNNYTDQRITLGVVYQY